MRQKCHFEVCKSSFLDMETHIMNVAVGVLFLYIISAAAFVKGNHEVDILVAWKATLKDPYNVLQSWDASLVNPCTWFHVTCNSDNTVVRLDLANAGLSGTISPLLGNLTNLQYLELAENSLTGEIPAEIGELSNLVGLNLSNNTLSGSIPPSFGKLKSLTFLALFDNKLTGAIPKEIGEARRLQRLDVYRNQFSGSIPSTLGYLTSLTHLRLNHNALSGEIPAEVLGLIRWGNLRILNVSNNKLAAPANITSTPKSEGLAITTIIQDRPAS